MYMCVCVCVCVCVCRLQDMSISKKIKPEKMSNAAVKRIWSSSDVCVRAREKMRVRERKDRGARERERERGGDVLGS